MINAKNELLELLEAGCKTLKAASIERDIGWNNESFELDYQRIYLYADYSEEEYEAFLNDLDFRYDEGFGGQLLHGVLWFTDGTHARRGTYDGAEWWVIMDVPDIPQRGEYLENAGVYSIGGG